MNEDQLRALVRDAVARHLEGAPGRFQPPPSASQPLTVSSHASHFRYSLPAVRRAMPDRAGGAVQPLRLLPVARALSGLSSA